MIDGKKIENYRIHDKLFSEKKSPIERYQDVFIGNKRFTDLVKYEIILLISSWVPGALGLFLRKIFYPHLLGKVGKNVIFGRNVVLRHPRKIYIGDNVAIDDNTLLDAKGIDNKGITIGNNVIIGRNCTIYCKDGDIHIGDDVSISYNNAIFSANLVKVGKGIRMGAYSYLNGGSHTIDRTDIPIWQQERSGNGIVLEDNVWLGANVKVLDGTKIGTEAIVGTGAVVTKDIPPFSVALGMPAKVVRSRLTSQGNKNTE